MAIGGVKGGVRIREDIDVFEARWAARAVARAAGFQSRDTAEIVIAVSELATNILKFAPPGHLQVEPIADPEHGPGVRITARDSGPPFPDLDQVLAKSSVVGGVMEWTGRGLGGGLGAVVRFTDSIHSVPCAGGKEVIAERYLKRPRRRRP